MFECFKRCCCPGGISPIKATDEMTQPVGQRHGQLFTAPGESNDLNISGLKAELNDDIIRYDFTLNAPFKCDYTIAGHEFNTLRVSMGAVYYDDEMVADSSGFFTEEIKQIEFTDGAKINVNDMLYFIQHVIIRTEFI